MKKPSMKWLLLLSLSMIVVSCTGCSTIRKAYWDYRVDELCKKDGGVKIYEKSVIRKSDYPDIKLTSSGEIIFPSKIKATSKDPFYYVSYTEYIKNGSLDVMKHGQSIFRSSDNKLMGTYISYGRRGGDFLFFEGPFHPSSYSCKDTEKNVKDFSSIVTIQGK